jgi:isopenicillin N synthase-like dioxygenase
MNSAFTILFQDERGGLELRDPKTQDFIRAEPEDGALIFNVANMLQRFTNGIIPFFSLIKHCIYN